MSKIDDRPYFVAEVTRVNGELAWNCEGAVLPEDVRKEVDGSTTGLYEEKDPQVFYVAYMRLGHWLWGHGPNPDRAITHLTERYEEATES